MKTRAAVGKTGKVLKLNKAALTKVAENSEWIAEALLKGTREDRTLSSRLLAELGKWTADEDGGLDSHAGHRLVIDLTKEPQWVDDDPAEDGE